jgi:hypothetical protein
MINIDVLSSGEGRAGEILEFRNSQKVGLHVLMALGASFFMIIIITLNLFIMFLSNKQSIFTPGLIGGLSVIPIMGIAAAIFLLKSPVRVVLDDAGLTLEWLIRRKTILWNEIFEIQIKETDGSVTWWGSFAGKKDQPKERLLLFDRNGRKFAEIPANVKPFDVLIREIHKRTSAVQGVSTFNIDKQTSLEKSARSKKRRLLLVAGVPLAALGIAFGIMACMTEHDKRLLEKDGRIIEAAVDRRYIYNITPRLQYSFTTPDGLSFSNNVMVEREYWDQIENNQTVSVKYLPAKPANNHLVSGQINSSDFPLPLSIVMSLFITILSIACIIMYFLRISDIKFENGRFKIIRENQIELSPAVSSLAQTSGSPSAAYVSQYQEPVPLPVILEQPTVVSHLKKLPAGLKAIGILNIVFGSMGVLWNASRFFIAYVIAFQAIEIAQNIELKINPAWILMGHGFAVLVALAFVLSGIVILLFHNWGRILAIICACVKLILGSVEIVSTLFFSDEITNPEQRFVASVATAFYIFFVLLTMVYPVIVLVILRRSSTREVFRSIGK